MLVFRTFRIFDFVQLRSELWLCLGLSLCLAPELAWGANGAESKTSGAFSTEQIIDRVIVSVDGEGLTLSDLRGYMTRRGEKAPSGNQLEDPAVKAALQDMVIENLLQREARGAGIGVSSEEVAAYIDEIKSQNRVDEAGLKRLLAQKGLSFEDYRIQVEKDIVKSRVIGMKVRGKVNLLDSEVDRYVRTHPKKFSLPPMYRVEQIVVKSIGIESEPAARSEAERIRVNALADPQSFPELYESGYSDLGRIDIEDLKPELAKALSKLGDAEVSEVIPTEEGFAVLRAREESSEQMEIQESVLQDARRELTQERFQEALEQYLKEELPRKYHVEYRTEDTIGQKE